MSKRKASVMGSFYPANPDEIKKMFKYFNRILDENETKPPLSSIGTNAVIVPHAGYVYSGFSANMAYRVLGNFKPKSAVVIGPSHKIYIKGSSIAEYDSFETPFGDLQIDKELTKTLKERFDLSFIPSAHQEHSTEVQMPFLKYYFGDIKVVELVYGDENPQNLKNIIDFILQDSQNAVIISTDLSHFHDIEYANMIDSICLEGVKHLDVAKLHRGCEACGKIGLEAMVLSARENTLKPILLDYRTSADINHDRQRVVGYMSAAFVKE
ncbi:MAG: AmmeMemoRadiSam system protein B [Epsilonproteobacteria bacterium]|nr:AmmeMemoRadiSam system protein B [Campylobacterota bacterium]